MTSATGHQAALPVAAGLHAARGLLARATSGTTSCPPDTCRPTHWTREWHMSTDLVDIALVAATAVLLVGRIHVDLLRVCTACCPGC